MLSLERLNSLQRPHRQLVDLAQASLPPDALDDEIIELLNSLIGFDSAAILRADFTKGLRSWKMDGHVRKLAEEAATRSRTRYAACVRPTIEATQRDGIWLDRCLERPEGRPESSPYLQEILRPAGLRSMLQLCARWKGRPLLRVHLHRFGRQRFDEHERDLLAAILPTVEAVLALNLMEARAPLHYERLTPREREVAGCVARGLTNSEAASALGTSPYTVRNQIARIFEKLEIGSRAELAAWAASMPEW